MHGTNTHTDKTNKRTEEEEEPIEMKYRRQEKKNNHRANFIQVKCFV